MTNAQTGALVLKDAAGGYYVLPPDVLEAARVSEERTAEFERFLAEAGGDVQGYTHMAAIYCPVGAFSLNALYGNDGTAASIGAMAAREGTALGGKPRQ